MTTDSYNKDKRAVAGWVGGVFAALVVGCLGFVASQLSAHETAVSVLRERQSMQEKRLDSMDAKLDKILEKVSKP